MAKGYSARRGFSGGGGMAQQQAQMQQKLMKMQQDMAKAQEDVENSEFTASVGGGAVTAVASGKKQLVSLTVKPEVVDPEDVEMLQDMIRGRRERGHALRRRGRRRDHVQAHRRPGPALLKSFYNNSKPARPASRAWRFFRIDVKSPALSPEPGLCVFSD